MPKHPSVSVLIVCYNMQRELPRTVLSFLPPYQRGLDLDEIEILVLDNGSTTPVSKAVQTGWPEQVQYIRVPNPQPSPAHALNYGAQIAKADTLCVSIDGARLASPGVLSLGLRAARTHENAFIATVGFHLGPKIQRKSVLDGYNQAVEDNSLNSIRWPENGYRLYEIASLAGSAKDGWFGPMAETNLAFLPKSLFETLDGFDEAFDLPGGGYVNLDFYMRALDRFDVEYVRLMGEASFHQYHGGVTTSVISLERAEAEHLSSQAKYRAQYEAIRGKPFKFRTRAPILIGSIPVEAEAVNLNCLKGLLQR